MLKKFLSISIIVLGATVYGFSQTKLTDTVMVLPFENASDLPEFNWVGESFAMSVSDLLRVPGLNTISNGERKIVQQRLRMPLASLPSLAASLRLSREAGVTLLVSGRYTIIPAQAETTATINVTARIIRVNEGRFLSEDLPDGRRITRDINLNDALGNLQTMQGQIAYQILYQRDKALPYSQNQLIESANKVPSRAFEAYIKGLLSPAGEARENYLRNAIRLYSETVPELSYSDAALELGHLYLNQNKPAEAIDAFERVISTNSRCKETARNENRPTNCSDENFAEASFYIGSMQWQRGNYEQALAVLRPLAEDLRLTSVYNTLGAIAVDASRAEKKNEQRSAALLSEGIDLLKKAAESAPEDGAVRFNYAYALFQQKNYVEASAQLKPIVEANPKDGESFYVLAKSLGVLKDATASAIDDKARTSLTVGNRYATLEKEWLKSATVSDIKLRVEQPKRRDFVSVVLSSRKTTTAEKPRISESDDLLAQARTFYKNGNDDEAMAVIRRILAGEPMSAESYLILGKIHLRRGDMDQAQSAFKTAIFWDNKQIDAHVALGKIFFEKGDCLQVKSYSASALEINAEYSDAVALGRQAERCSK